MQSDNNPSLTDLFNLIKLVDPKLEHLHNCIPNKNVDEQVAQQIDSLCTVHVRFADAQDSIDFT